MKPTLRDAIPAAETASARERRVDAYIVSSDDALLLELGPALGDRFRTRPIERLDELPTDLQAPWIGFVDGARADARNWIQHIEKNHPHAALIAIVAGNDLPNWQGMVFRGSVCAALGIQQIGTAAMNDALARAQQRLLPSATIMHAEPLRPRPAASGGASSPGRRRWLLPALGLAGLLVTTLAWWLLADHKAPGTTANGARGTAPAARTPAGALAAPTAPAMSVLELLSGARSAFRDPDRQLPRTDGRQHGDSALELYGQVLAQEPANAEARDGLRRLYTVGHSRMQSDLAAGRMDEAQRMLAIFRAAGVDPAAMKTLESEVSAAQPRWLQTQVRRALAANDVATAEQAYAQLVTLGADRSALQDLRRALDTHQADAQLQSLADEVHAAIVVGALIEPAATSARTRWQAMRQANRSHPATLAAQRELQDALLARAREAQAAVQYESAQRWLVAASDIGASNEIAEARRLLQADMDKAAARAAATAAPPPVAATAVAPTPAPPAPAAPLYISARPLRALKVDYPVKAAEAGTQGYVILEFTLSSDGRPSDIQVIESSPVNVFDRAAQDAVRRGRYDTSALGDDPQPRRARLRVSFKPS